VGWLPWLVGFLVVHVTMGLTMSIIFQLAHVVEKTSFHVAEGEHMKLETAWAEHEIMTTANFAPNDKILSWFIGGLNYQVEHHLFPTISHIHYPAISKIVREQCQKFSLPYHCYSSVWEAIASHFRFMKYLGRNASGVAA